MHPVDPEILTVNPDRHQSIINSWPIEEADARHRRLRAENLATERILDKFADPEIPTKDVESLAYALADLKKQDRAADKIRADLELAHRRVEAQRELASERASALIQVAKLRADAQRELMKLRTAAALELTKLRTEAAIQCARLRAEAQRESARLRAEAQRDSAHCRADSQRSAQKPAEDSPAPNKKRPPFAAANGAPYGRKPDGSPHTRAEFLAHLRQACADIYGFNLDINPPKHRPEPSPEPPSNAPISGPTISSSPTHSQSPPPKPRSSMTGVFGQPATHPLDELPQPHSPLRAYDTDHEPHEIIPCAAPRPTLSHAGIQQLIQRLNLIVADPLAAIADLEPDAIAMLG